MFAGAFFGTRYFGPRYFGKSGQPLPVADGDYFGNRHFGPSYFGPRYFGGGKSTTPPPVAQEQGGGAFGFGRIEPTSRRSPGAAATEALKTLRKARQVDEPAEDSSLTAPPIALRATETPTGPRNEPTERPGKPDGLIPILRQTEPSEIQITASELAAREALAELVAAEDRGIQASTDKARSNRNRIAILIALLLADR